ncbi:MAG: M48 family metallopeptidase [Pirellulaceae bacterium]|nr:M48 family metallopeptidase [Pirellulaceae bacterium]
MSSDLSHQDLPNQATVQGQQGTFPTGLSDHVNAGMTPEELSETKRYHTCHLVCRLLDTFLDLGVLASIVFFCATPFDAWLQSFHPFQSAWWRLPIFFLTITAIHLVLSFPLAYYAGFVLEHRFQLSRQSQLRWLARHLVKCSLSSGFGLLLVTTVFGIIWFFGTWWWCVAALVAFLFSIGVGQLAPVLILPLFYKIEKMTDPALTAQFHQLAAGTSLQIEGVYRMCLSKETVKANAMLAGLGRTRRVILGDTLITGFTADEVAVVLAHEIGHHVFRHIPKLIGLGMISSLLSLWFCDVVLRWQLATGEVIDYRQVPVSFLPLLMLLVTACSLIYTPLQNTLSRHFERQSDQFALQKTGNPDAFRSAFRKLAKLNKADPDPPVLQVWLFHDHPPISERLAYAEVEPTMLSDDREKHSTSLSCAKRL